MKIALLNLPLDNNFGGNLQRYALVIILQKLGHEVVHLYLERRRNIRCYKKPFVYCKRFLLKYIFQKKDIIIFSEYKFNLEQRKKNSYIEAFYNSYIPHTSKIYTISGIKNEFKKYAFNCIIVGSDQVWRKQMTSQIGLNNYFLNFINKKNIRKVAYGVSMGTSDISLTKEDKIELSHLYKLFYAVSVREQFMLNVFQKLGWENPKAKIVLDPTLLLKVEDYRIIFEGKSLDITTNKIFCYILDENESVKSIIKKKSLELQLEFTITSLSNSLEVTIEQWLNNIYQSSFVITDSYHGVVFSILFNKDFIFLGNKFRGNERIDSLFSMLEIDPNLTHCLDWIKINNKISKLRKESIDFLCESLN